MPDRIANDVSHHRENQRGLAFLNAHAYEMEITRVDNSPPEWGTIHGFRYHIILRPKGISFNRDTPEFEALTFYYWDSRINAEESRSPSYWDILECIATDMAIPGAYADFCADFGYNPDLIRSQTIWEKCQEHVQNIHRILTPSMIEGLRSLDDFRTKREKTLAPGIVIPDRKPR